MFWTHKATKSLTLGIGAGVLVLIAACSAGCSGAPIGDSDADEVNVETSDDGIKPNIVKGVTYSKCENETIMKIHGDGALGNARLAPITNDTVPCVHKEDGNKVDKCTFKTTSGLWVEGKNGSFAVAGQAISPAGEPGGDWVIGAKVSTKGTVPCIEPTGKDSAGVPYGTELAGACAVEVMNSATNVTGLTIENYSTLQVCTSSKPHPDGAPLVAGKTNCYWQKGAALNDRYGTERDAAGVYMPGEDRCHVVWSSGVEVPAAKRPATTSYPAPGAVNPNTPIVWRPVNNSVPIANP